ncbi:hypothetical protein BY996DRAFT_7425789 [Phakopsora pachyrhizi]|uniref:Small ribosomal subunit protein mS41 n=1 Tax=Phakopsora pachyrhizi TaxID=170000 RepID=A0AAV0ASJ9_PHAPC|nr:hypothetical protein BY996DRAFT_7425789 [Phakopsora pachyrhizi]CAH7671757.1 expressed protein [Phakopsora pachyrhizi]CAH7673986.1 expressed protein [Phakopsora pachyrhizi]
MNLRTFTSKLSIKHFINQQRQQQRTIQSSLFKSINQELNYSTAKSTNQATTDNNRTVPEPSHSSHSPSYGQLVKFRELSEHQSYPKIPKPHHGVETVEGFLDSLRRPKILEALKDKVKSWEELFELDSRSFKRSKELSGAINLVRDRRYFFRALELFRQGLDPKVFSVGDRKPKKIRGWGPRVQNGIRLRGNPGGKLNI